MCFAKSANHLLINIAFFLSIRIKIHTLHVKARIWARLFINLQIIDSSIV